MVFERWELENFGRYLVGEEFEFDTMTRFV